MPLTKESDFNTKIEYSLNKAPKCPHCDTDIDMSDEDFCELYNEGEHDISCPDCGKQIMVVTTVKYLFSTDNQPEFE